MQFYNFIYFRKSGGEDSNEISRPIELKGTKNVKISTIGNDKSRVSVILSITGNGHKLVQMMIFKGQHGKTIEK